MVNNYCLHLFQKYRWYSDVMLNKAPVSPARQRQIPITSPQHRQSCDFNSWKGHLMHLTNTCIAAAIVSALVAISAAPTQAATTGPAQKSTSVATLNDGDALMIGHKGQRIFKSNTKVSSVAEKSAMANGAKQIAAGTVIYKEGGKLYMLPGNDQAEQTFQGDFAIGY
jgi:hypothetical protein